MRFDYQNVPIFIICRDKVSPLRSLVEWLEQNEYRRIILVDNASTYPPLLEFYEASPHNVVRLDENLGPYRSIWSSGVGDRYASNEFYVVTDPDVIPDPDCPGDAVGLFHWALARFPRYSKAGFGLRIDDLPVHNDLAQAVRRWEYRFWTRRFSQNLYRADIDTTFALYRPNSPFSAEPAIRTGRPYLARHQPWYVDSRNRSDEDKYYIQHCRTKTAHWDLGGHVAPATKSRASRLKGLILWKLHVLLRLERDRAVSRRYRPS